MKELLTELQEHFQLINVKYLKEICKINML